MGVREGGWEGEGGREGGDVKVTQTNYRCRFGYNIMAPSPSADDHMPGPVHSWLSSVTTTPSLHGKGIAMTTQH